MIDTFFVDTENTEPLDRTADSLMRIYQCAVETKVIDVFFEKGKKMEKKRVTRVESIGLRTETVIEAVREAGFAVLDEEFDVRIYPSTMDYILSQKP